MTKKEQRHVTYVDEKLVEKCQVDIALAGRAHLDPVALVDQRRCRYKREEPKISWASPPQGYE
jgi:hypothetical protein